MSILKKLYEKSEIWFSIAWIIAYCVLMSAMNSMGKFIPTAMGNISLNYTTEKYNIFLNADAGLRQRGNRSESDIEYLDNSGNPITHNAIEQFSLNPNRMGSVKIGGEYFFDEKNSVLLSSAAP